MTEVTSLFPSLRQLCDKNLAERVSRGSDRITAEGRALLQRKTP